MSTEKHQETFALLLALDISPSSEATKELRVAENQTALLRVISIYNPLHQVYLVTLEEEKSEGKKLILDNSGRSKLFEFCQHRNISIYSGWLPVLAPRKE